MPGPIVTVDQDAIKSDLRELVRRTVEDTLNGLLEEEADDLVGAGRYERTAGREAYRAGHYERTLTTTSGDVTLRMPKLKGMRFTTAAIDRYRRRETSVEEAMIEMYLAGVSTRRIEDVSEALWGASVSASTVSNLNERAFAAVEERGSRPLTGSYPYVYVDGIYLKRSWGGSYENVAVMVAIGVNEEGYREAVGPRRASPSPPSAGGSSSRGSGLAACAGSGCSPGARPPAWWARSRRCSRTRPTRGAPCTSTGVFCQVDVDRSGISFGPFERRVSGRFGVGRSCWSLVIALVIA